jgi:hypothetical protein
MARPIHDRAEVWFELEECYENVDEDEMKRMKFLK